MYAKLFNQVLLSSLTQDQPIENRGVFFMLLAAADKKGYIIGMDSSIARVINVPMDIFSRALAALMEPDPGSQSKDEDGRRIVRLEDAPGLLIVNYEKYSGIGSDEQRREYFRVKKAESRAKAKAAGANKVPPPEEDDSDVIAAIYDAYPKKVGKPDALRAIAKALKKFEYDFLLERTRLYARARSGQDQQYTPHPSTWFNEQRFNDDPSTWKNSAQPSKPPPEQNQMQEKIHVRTL
jgi:hypothetical protein